MRSIKIGIVLLCALSCTGARADVFSYSDLLSEETPTAQAVAYMGTLVRERSRGRHDIKEVASNIADTDNFTLARLQSGKIAMARVRLATFHNTIPEAVIPSFPYLFKSRESLRRVLEGPLGNAILARMPEKGLIGLCFYDTGLRSFYSKKPIRRVEELKDMKIRVQGGDAFGQVLQSVRAVPQQLPFGRIYDALKSGVIDGADLDLLTYAGARHYEFAKYYSLTEHSRAPSVLVFSRQIWDKLSSEDRAIIKAAAGESVPHLYRLWDKQEAEARQLLEKADVQLVADVDKTSFSDAMVPAFSRLVTHPKLQDWLASIERTEPLN